MNKRTPILLGFLLLVLAVWLQIAPTGFFRPLITRLNNMAYDIQLNAKLLTHREISSSPIVIIDIDDKSLKAEGRWPWPRAKLALLVNQVGAYGAIVSALDMMFPEKEINTADVIQTELNKKQLLNTSFTHILQQIKPEFDNDNKLAKSFAEKDVALGFTLLPHRQLIGFLPPPALRLAPDESNLSFLNAEGAITNIEILARAAKHGGFINVYPDNDGIIRRIPLVMRYQNDLYPSLALKAVQLYLLSDVKLITARYQNTSQLEAIQLGNHIIPTDALGQAYIPFRGKAFSFPYYSATDVLHNRLPPHTFDGKIVFIGTSATGISDLRATAVDGVFPGVEIQATIAEGILKDSFSHRPAWTKGAEISLTFFLGLAALLSFPFLGPNIVLLFTILIPFSLILINNWLWIKTGLILFVLIPILLIILLAVTNIIYGYFFETRRRERLKQMFGQYVPEQHIDEMLKAEDDYALYGEDREMTVLFADIRNFTSISEHLSAAELKNLLNQFFTPMTEIIFKHQGTIDKYIGDLIMAFWGAPLKDKQHSQHALKAALDMQKAAEKLQNAFAEKNWPAINIGVGINSGMMSVGDMGSKFRRNYTVLGDAVNLASRIEGLTKFYGVKIITTAATQHNQKKFVFRKLDLVIVKGKQSAVAIYELICLQSELTESLHAEISKSEKALEYYFQQQWDHAHKLFNELSTTFPATRLYSLYLKRIEDYKNHPPAIGWDGVYAHSAK